MKEEKDRIRLLRKSLNLTLEEFGKHLGVTKMTISRIENGVNGITEQMRTAICREYKVSEVWLRTGNGNMFSNTLNDEIDAVVDRYHLNSKAKQTLLKFVELTDDERAAILKYMSQVVEAIQEEDKNEQEGQAISAADLTEEDIRKLGEEYMEQLRLEKKQAEESLRSEGLDPTGSDI